MPSRRQRGRRGRSLDTIGNHSSRPDGTRRSSARHGVVTQHTRRIGMPCRSVCDAMDCERAPLTPGRRRVAGLGGGSGDPGRRARVHGAGTRPEPPCTPPVMAPHALSPARERSGGSSRAGGAPRVCAKAGIMRKSYATEPKSANHSDRRPPWHRPGKSDKVVRLTINSLEPIALLVVFHPRPFPAYLY